MNETKLVERLKVMAGELPPQDLPFHLKYPEYNLKPVSQIPNLSFGIFDYEPDYVEYPIELISNSKFRKYLWIVKTGLFGIMFWEYKPGFFGKNWHKTIIKCEYEEIEKDFDKNLFICYKDGKRIFYDYAGIRLST